jgi:acetyl esterase/lipase
VPVVVWIHGGAWQSGTNRVMPGLLPTAAMRDALLERSIAFASLQYRHSGEARFPACFQDVVAAVRWLRHFAGALGLDPSRLGTWGESAGGHLAVLLALNIRDPELLGDLGVGTGDTTVQAAVGWYAPSDLLTMQEQALDPGFPDHDAPDSPESLLIGAPVQTVPDLVRRASPVAHASASAAPLLLLHGAADVVVSPRQSEELAGALRAAGADVELELVPGADHVFGGVDPLPLVLRSVAFLAERLAG